MGGACGTNEDVSSDYKYAYWPKIILKNRPLEIPRLIIKTGSEEVNLSELQEVLAFTHAPIAARA
jgi:hypothetical protein